MGILCAHAVPRECALEGTGLQEAWSLQFWMQPCSCRLVIHAVTDVIVPLCAIAPTIANKTMIPEAIHDAVADVAN